MAQHPIESKWVLLLFPGERADPRRFIPGMVDSLNAEISLGTIANVQEAIQWLGYTYLFVRMRKEPFVYGQSHRLFDLFSAPRESRLIYLLHRDAARRA
jgi:antiviral helicase SLH1